MHTKKQVMEKFGLIIPVISNNSENIFKLVFFTSRFLYISHIAFQGFTFCLDSEINTPVTPLSFFFSF